MLARRIVIVPYSAEAMFALADGVESYPDFLPWCESAEVERNGEEVRAALHIKYFGLKTSLATRNRHRRPHRIDMRLAEGPLKSLSGSWEFSDLGDGRCRVEFFLQYQFARGVLGAVFERLFDGIFGRFVDSFLRRAKEIYESGMRITVASEDGEKTLMLPQGATVGDALVAAGFSGSDSISAGIFGRECGRETPLKSGDRVEVYSPLPQSPQRRRQKAADS